MHVLFVHNNFPAQFGHVAARLVEIHGWECTFVSETEPGVVAGIRKIRYAVDTKTAAGKHPLSRAFDGDVRHAAGIYDALRPLRGELRPDLIVGHAGLGPTLFLSDLFPGVPIIDYFEDFYDPGRASGRFRPEWPPSEEDVMRARAQNAMTLLQLESCDAGYTPTAFQRDLLPEAYRSKVRVIHDGIDTRFWRRPEGRDVSGSRVVTYIARGLDAMRGFDVFMRAASRVCAELPDVTFYVVGSDEGGYGDEMKQLAERTFKEHVLASGDYDLERIRFLGWVRPEALVQLLAMSDLHIYLTVPIVLSWSMLDAMACRCVVLGSDTEPVREVIRDGENGLLRGFDDVDALAGAALDALRDPGRFEHLGRAAERTIAERFSLDVTLPQTIAFYREVAG